MILSQLILDALFICLNKKLDTYLNNFKEIPKMKTILLNCSRA